MNNYLIRLLAVNALLLWTVSLVAQPAKVAEPSLAPTAEENCLLWKISGEELSTPSYLYGTIHMIAADDYVLRPEASTAFAQAERIVFEIDMDEMNNPMAIMGLMSNMYMPDGLTVKDLVDSAEYAMVSQHFDRKGLPMMALGRMKPMFLSVLVGMDMNDMQANGKGGLGGLDLGDGIKSYELEFTQMATAAGKPTDGLETLAFQMSIFDSIPYPAQAQMLVESVRSEVEGTDDDINDLDKMTELYLNEKIVEMVGMMQEEASIAEFEDILLEKRNRNWIPKMTKMMTEAPVFFAVGAGHLAGEVGVIALLRQAGYTVEPVFAEKE
ncbi:MAG: TraB/GumN family protein [Bacteroidota bacterium]